MSYGTVNEFAELKNSFLTQDWLAESVRATLFFDSQLEPLCYWEKLTGRRPSEINERTAEAFRMEVGDFGAGGLFVIQQGSPSRIDVVYADKPTQPFVIGPGLHVKDLVHVGPATIALASFLNLIKLLEPLLSNITRVAFSPIFVRQAQSASEAAKFIGNVTRLPINDGDTDVTWIVNKPVKATSFAGIVNRVVKWQSMTAQTVQFSPLTVAQTSSATAVHFARLETETNSWVEAGLLEHPMRSFTEIVNITIAMLSQ